MMESDDSYYIDMSKLKLNLESDNDGRSDIPGMISRDLSRRSDLSSTKEKPLWINSPDKRRAQASSSHLRRAPNVSTSLQDARFLSSIRPNYSHLVSHTAKETDDESVMTEDYESRFNTMVVKHVGGPSPLPEETIVEGDDQVRHLQASNVQPTDARTTSKVYAMQQPSIISHASKDSWSPRKKPYAGRNEEHQQQQQLLVGGGKSKTRSGESEDYSAEIRKQSQRIQRELMEERKKQTATRITAESVTTPRELLDRNVDELSDLNSSIVKVKKERDALNAELDKIRGLISKNHTEVDVTKQLVAENRTKAEDSRTELMVTEMKRQFATNDLAELNAELTKKKDALRGLEEKVVEKLKEIHNLEDIGLTKEEIENVIRERNELFQLIRAGEENASDGYEMEKQVTHLREKVASERLAANEKMSKLQIEMQECYALIGELRNERAGMQEQYAGVENELTKLRERSCSLEQQNAALQEGITNIKSSNSEESVKEKKLFEQEIATIKTESENQRESLQMELEKLRLHLSSTDKTLQGKSEAESLLRSENDALRSKLKQVELSKSLFEEETNQRLADLQKQKELEIQEIKTVQFEENKRVYKEITQKFNEEKDQELENATREHHYTVEDLQRTVSSKELEVEKLKEHIKQQGEYIRRIQSDMETEAQEKVRSAVNNERLKWENEQEDKWRSDLSSLKSETTATIDTLQCELERHQNLARRQNEEVDVLKQEIEEERTKVRNAIRDKIAAVAEAKEDAKEEVDKMFEDARQEQLRVTSTEVYALESRLEENIRQLSEMRMITEKLAQSNNYLKEMLCQLQNTAVNEINEECSRSATVLQINPRVVDIEQSSQEAGTDEFEQSISENNLISDALANLEATGSELREFVQELKRKLRSEQSKSSTDNVDIEQQMKTLRREFEEEKSRDMTVLREQLVKEHLEELKRASSTPHESMQRLMREKELEMHELQKSMRKWKQQTAERLATKLQEEFKKEFEKKIKAMRSSLKEKDFQLETQSRQMLQLENEMSTNQTTMRTQSQLPADGAAKVIKQLRDRITELRQENLSLRRTNAARPASPTVDLLKAIHTESIRSSAAATPVAVADSEPRVLRPSKIATTSKGSAESTIDNKLRLIEDKIRLSTVKHDGSVDSGRGCESFAGSERGGARQLQLFRSRTSSRDSAASMPVGNVEVSIPGITSTNLRARN